MKDKIGKYGDFIFIDNDGVGLDFVKISLNGLEGVKIFNKEDENPFYQRSFVLVGHGKRVSVFIEEMFKSGTLIREMYELIIKKYGKDKVIDELEKFSVKEIIGLLRPPIYEDEND